MIFGQSRQTLNPTLYPPGADILRIWDLWDWSPGGYGANIGQINPSKGVFRWKTLDGHIDAALKKGVPQIYCFGATPDWAAIPTDQSVMGPYTPLSNRPMQMDAMNDFLDAILAHTGNIIEYWEPMNEWNSLGMWCGTLEQLVQRQTQIYSKIKGAMPQAQVFTPTPCLNTTNAYPSVPIAMEAFFKTGAPFDLIAFHGYLNAGEPAQNICPMLDDLIAVCKTYGHDGIGMWDTEWGPGLTNSIPESDRWEWTTRGIQTRIQYALAGAIWYQTENRDWGTVLDSNAVLTTYGKAWVDNYNTIKQAETPAADRKAKVPVTFPWPPPQPEPGPDPEELG
jgi:hypothetical protein